MRRFVASHRHPTSRALRSKRWGYTTVKQSGPTSPPAATIFTSVSKDPVDAGVAPSSTKRDALMEALAANPQFKVVPRSGKGFIIGGQR